MRELSQDHGKHLIILILQRLGKIYWQTAFFLLLVVALSYANGGWTVQSETSWSGNCYLSSIGLCKSQCNVCGKLMGLAGILKKV